jgi:hypothetical protein
MIACLPGPGDATSLYRAVGPFSQLRRMIDIDIEYPQGFMWTVVRSADIVFLQRPCTNDHLTIATMTKNCNTPLWIDIDDDLLDVPPENPAWEHYREEAVKENIRQCLKLADVITTASPVLADRIKEFNSNIKVIPNAFDETWLKHYDPLKKKTNPKVVAWRGTNSHIKDLAIVAEDVHNVANKHPDLIWRFIGFFPWFLQEALKGRTVEHVKGMDPFQYFQYLINQANHQIAICPLVDNALNKSKSNIAWQEHTLAGAITVAPDFPEWQLDGIQRYGKERSFQDTLLNLIENPQFNHDKLTISLDSIRKNLFLSKINEKRIEVIYELLGRNVDSSLPRDVETTNTTKSLDL